MLQATLVLCLQICCLAMRTNCTILSILGAIISRHLINEADVIVALANAKSRRTKGEAS